MKSFFPPTIRRAVNSVLGYFGKYLCRCMCDHSRKCFVRRASYSTFEEKKLFNAGALRSPYKSVTD